MIQPMPQIPLDSVEIPDGKLDSLLHIDEKQEHGIAMRVKRMTSKVVVVSSTWIAIVGNIDCGEH
jgi:hypothetical protein